jgi:hypothetical protein
MQDGARADNGSPGKTAKLVRLMTLFAAAAVGFLSRPVTATTKKLDLPYVTIDHPQFILAPQATFLSPHDIVIGVTDGKTAKAYPAAVLAQHGVVQD